MRNRYDMNTEGLEALAWVLVTVGLALGCVIGVCVAGFAGWGCGP